MMRFALALLLLAATSAYAEPVIGQIKKVTTQHKETVITINKGSTDGIADEHTGCILDRSSTCIAPITIFRIDKKRTFATVALPTSKVDAHAFIRFEIPPPPPPPPPVIAHVTAIAPDDRGFAQVTTDAGFNDGVDRNVLGCLLAADDTCIADAVIIRVSKTESVVLVKLAPARIDPKGRVRLYHP